MATILRADPKAVKVAMERDKQENAEMREAKGERKGRPGACIPETMRFNDRGIEYESSWKPISIGRDCDAEFHPYYNACTLFTSAEVSLWIWQQYLATDDRAFLQANYPVMASSAASCLPISKRVPTACFTPAHRMRMKRSGT